MFPRNPKKKRTTFFGLVFRFLGSNWHVCRYGSNYLFLGIYINHELNCFFLQFMYLNRRLGFVYSLKSLVLVPDGFYISINLLASEFGI
jgi:hypothetical protein